jgi:hypothetical protein
METNWPQRTSSTVAPQSLVLMNHPFVREAAAALADRIEKRSAEDRVRIYYAFRSVYGREPTADEVRLVEQARSDGSDWEIIAHALLSSNEFLYVD